MVVAVLFRLFPHLPNFTPITAIALFGAELMPIDPIVNDHLGDVYWMVGRKTEAEFQWRRALSFDPEEEEIQRIKKKLKVGLTQVLIDESKETGLLVK